MDLVAHLRRLDRARLTALIAARPDAVALVEPENLNELAERLCAEGSLAAALRRVPVAGLQLIDALCALGGTTGRNGLTALLDVDGKEDLLEEVLLGLIGLALVLPDDDGVLHLVGPLADRPGPLGLGEPLVALLAGERVDALRRMSTVLGVASTGPKQEVRDRLRATLGDPEVVRAQAAQLPPRLRTMLVEVAWNKSQVVLQVVDARRLVDRGLLFGSVWDGGYTMAAEVALALRGRDYRAPFTPPPPDPVSGVVDAAELTAACAGAVTETLADVLRLVDRCDRTPLALTKAGHLGVREQRRVAGQLGVADDKLVALVNAARAADLLANSDGHLVRTEAADVWRRADPAVQLATLLSAGDPLRRAILDYLVALPAGARVDGVAPMLDHLLWTEPTAFDAPDPDSLGAEAAAAWRVAEWFGLVARGAATPLARALAEGSDLVAAVAGLVPEPVGTATFQSDLSVVVAGAPTAALAGLLDTVATRESAGAASTWRLSAASVRAALDDGADADGLLADLAAVATGRLPQTLEYLLADVARQHGTVQVSKAGCVVCADAALVAEIAATRLLKPLKLRAVAPTVLVSPRPPAETLTALRAAGYAPTSHDASGATTVERRPIERAPARRDASRTPKRTPGQALDRLPIDHDAVAARLLAAPVGAPRVAARQRNGLSDAEFSLLRHALHRGEAVRISYVSATGQFTARDIEPAELDGDMLVAWCRLRDAERMFLLSRIRSVTPL